MLSAVSIAQYRALRDVRLALGPLTVVTGANGAGKSTLYRALELLKAAADGDLSARLAAEGGLASALWAGQPWRTAAERGQAARPRAKGAAQIRLSATLDGLRYDLTLGAPRPTDAALALDPVVKEERVTALDGPKPVALAERKGPRLSVRDERGLWRTAAADLWLFETALAAVSDPAAYPELDRLRRGFSAMRFHHHLRTDPESPLRAPRPAIMTPSVDSSGENWAPALASLARIEQDGFADSPAARAVAAAFPGGALDIAVDDASVSVGLRTAEFGRPFAARELSDGTLRFLALTAALTALRPPPFLALNEPEASLHADLIAPLADLIGAAADRGRLLVVTHDATLADRLEVEHGAARVRLTKERGETIVAGG